ncbi:MAG: transketolase [Anaerolineae bacterium]
MRDHLSGGYDPDTPGLDALCINTIRFLAVDAVQKANSGHPGMPMGAAAFAYTLWDRFLKHNPRDPHWPNRDRFVLSAGHGSMLLYALLHLTGYDLPMEEIKRFRQWGSRTPGHPEYRLTPGVEATTGPLGQGIGNAVGMAIAEQVLAERFNRPGHTIIDHYTYVVVSDGDLMEGISSEVSSLAGHLRLGKLIVLYDSNRITIEGSTELTFTEDAVARFAAYGWHVQSVDEGNDVDAIEQAIRQAREVSDRPSFIKFSTHIGYGSPHKQDTGSAHGEPLGAEEARLTKSALGWPQEPAFHVPEKALEHYRLAVERGARWQADWQARFATYTKAFPELAAEFERTLARRLPERWASAMPRFTPDDGPLATRAASGKVIAALAPSLPELMGGAGDLAPSTNTLIRDGGRLGPDDRGGRNMHFGVREHAMGAVLNGMAYHGGLIPYGGTFLIFSDYMRPPIRLAALSELPVIFLFTHDSIGLGEDGPTHQPVEHLVSLRAIPNMVVIRPADANETVAAWKVAVERARGPTALILTRQKLPVLDLDRYPNIPEGTRVGAYVLVHAPTGPRPDLVLVVTGSEVHLALAVRKELATRGVHARVVSMPSWNLFVRQPAGYRNKVIPDGVPILAIEAGAALGWQSYVGPQIQVVAVERFGASAPGDEVMREYGLNVEHVCQKAEALVAADREMLEVGIRTTRC